jgi:hypothetical protein
VLTKVNATDYNTIWSTPFSKATADTLYLPLTGGALAGPGNLTIAGTLGVTGATTHAATITLTAGNVIVQNGYLSLASNQPLLWNNDQAHKIVDDPSNNRMSFYEWQSEMRFYRGDTGNFMRLVGLPTQTSWWALENSNGDLLHMSRGTAHLGSNAYHDGTNWQRYNTANPSSLLQMLPSSGGMVFYAVPAGTGVVPWASKFQVDGNGNGSFAGNLTVQGTGALTLTAGPIIMPQGNAVQWGGTGNQIQGWTNNNFYFDSNGGWNFRDSGHALATAMTLTPAGNLTVTGNVQVGAGAQFQWANGPYLVDSGNDLLYRSLGSGYHYFQNTGGSPGTIVVGNVSASSTVDVVTWMRCQSGTLYMTTLGGSVGIQVDNATNGNWNHYAPNGSGNVRMLHADGSWCGVQGGTYQTQSSIRSKSAVADVFDVDAMERVRKPLRAATWDAVGHVRRQRSIGFIAEEIEEVVPEVVGYHGSGEVFGIEYGPLVAVLWAAVRYMDMRLRALEGA